MTTADKISALCLMWAKLSPADVAWLEAVSESYDRPDAEDVKRVDELWGKFGKEVEDGRSKT